MKAFTVHDIFKIAQFTDAPCIIVNTMHKSGGDDDNNNNNNNLQFISCCCGVFIMNTEEYLFKVPSKLEIN
jgi:iron only hydrogenase large subunit-like protein